MGPASKASKKEGIFITFTNVFFYFGDKNAFLTFFILFPTFITSLVDTIRNKKFIAVLFCLLLPGLWSNEVQANCFIDCTGQ